MLKPTYIFIQQHNLSDFENNIFLSIRHISHANGPKEFQVKLNVTFSCVNILRSFTFGGQPSLIYFKLSQVLHQIHDLGFSNLLNNKLNDAHKRFGTKITLMHRREISKKDSTSLWSNPMIELSITTLKIC